MSQKKTYNEDELYALRNFLETLISCRDAADELPLPDCTHNYFYQRLSQLVEDFCKEVPSIDELYDD